MSSLQRTFNRVHTQKGERDRSSVSMPTSCPPSFSSYARRRRRCRHRRVTLFHLKRSPRWHRRPCFIFGRIRLPCVARRIGTNYLAGRQNGHKITQETMPHRPSPRRVSHFPPRRTPGIFGGKNRLRYRGREGPGDLFAPDDTRPE